MTLLDRAEQSHLFQPLSLVLRTATMPRCSVLTTIGGMRRAFSRPDNRCVAGGHDIVIVRGGAGDGTRACTHAPWGNRGLARDRPVRRVHDRGGRALTFEVLNRTASAHFIGVSRSLIPLAGADPLPARFRISGAACHGWQRDARQARREPVTDDHGAGRACDFAAAGQGRRGSAAAVRIGLPAGRGRALQTNISTTVMTVALTGAR